MDDDIVHVVCDGVGVFGDNHDDEEDNSIYVTPTENMQNPYAGRKIWKIMENKWVAT